MHRHALVLVAAGALAAVAVGLAQAAPPPGHEETLRSLIGDAALGRIG